MRKKYSGKAQIWIETVIYTLIALIMIGAVLTFARPKIQEIQDKIVIDQSFESLEEIDSQIMSAINGGIGNKRIISVEIKKGELKIDDQEPNQILFILKDSRSIYSEPTTDPEKFLKIGGKIEVQTQKTGKTAVVVLRLKYDPGDVDIIYSSEYGNILGKSPSPYKFTITNLGLNDIKIEVGS